MLPHRVLERIDAERQRHVDELSDFLRIPSVSTDPEHASDVRAAAGWVSNKLDRLGLQVKLYETELHPVVFGQRLVDPSLPTLLIYGHYDVQPPDPLDEWATPPFSPRIRNGFIYGRGATDNKGQFLTYLEAIEAILSVDGHLPINVKILVEGEEEIGSPSLEAFFKNHQRELETDFIAISDGSQFSAGMPAITYGLRGLAYLQIDLQGPHFDLHSGSFGGLVANPVQALAGILSRLKNPDGTVAIPGFYDDVKDLESEERQEMAELPVDENRLLEYLGVEQLVGESGFAIMERKSSRPTLDINGIWGGFSGEGAKTIIPARGGAKVSMRLVPNQRASRINELFERFVLSLVPPGVTIKISEMHGSDPVLIDRKQPAVKAAARAIEAGFGKRPLFIREGGSIPIVSLFKQILKCESILLLGWGSPDDGAHSPNERFSLEDFHRGTRAAATLLYELKKSLTQ
jgi:acetylornithine deacetylase/succinyl-diaminopimelate desuccinylase-like protein